MIAIVDHNLIRQSISFLWQCKWNSVHEDNEIIPTNSTDAQYNPETCPTKQLRVAMSIVSNWENVNRVFLLGFFCSNFCMQVHIQKFKWQSFWHKMPTEILLVRKYTNMKCIHTILRSMAIQIIVCCNCTWRKRFSSNFQNLSNPSGAVPNFQSKFSLIASQASEKIFNNLLYEVNVNANKHICCRACNHNQTYIKVISLYYSWFSVSGGQ